MKQQQHLVAFSYTHRFRYARYKLGKTPEEIAKEDKVAITTVQKSIMDVEAQNSMLSLDEVERAENELVLYTRDYRKAALTEALQANRTIYGTGDKNTGEIIASEPDHETRLHAVDSITKIVTAVGTRHSKGNTTAVNVNQNVVTQNNSVTTYEDRLRKAHERREQSSVENLLPPESVIDIAQGEA